PARPSACRNASAACGEKSVGTRIFRIGLISLAPGSRWCAVAVPSGLHVAVVVPEPDGRVVKCVLVAQDAEGSRAQQEGTCVSGGQADPAGGQDGKEVAVAEQQGVPARVAEEGDNSVGAGADVRDGFAPRAAVTEEVPARPLRADLRGPPSLVRAVVPL